MGKEGHNVLNDISFDVKAGQKIGVIGSTGSGKSTLIQLIPRLYDVNDGSITFDGLNVKQLDIDTLRRQIGVVTQKATVFSGSIGTNVRYGKEDASFDELKTASTLANAFEFVSEYDDMFNHVTEHAFVRQPKLLILDDSTSAVVQKHAL